MVLVRSIPEDKHHRIGVVEGVRRHEVKKEEREIYKEEYYSLFLESYEAEEYGGEGLEE